MVDIEKVKKALECCSTGGHCLSGCPYDDDDDEIYNCTSAMAKDALELLKEKRSKSPTWRRGKAFCGGCGGCLENKEQHSSDIVKSIRFCKWCGTPVDWSNE